MRLSADQFAAAVEIVLRGLPQPADRVTLHAGEVTIELTAGHRPGLVVAGVRSPQGNDDGTLDLAALDDEAMRVGRAVEYMSTAQAIQSLLDELQAGLLRESGAERRLAVNEREWCLWTLKELHRRLWSSRAAEVRSIAQGMRHLSDAQLAARIEKQRDGVYREAALAEQGRRRDEKERSTTEG